jgi:hypothetical protein
MTPVLFCYVCLSFVAVEATQIRAHVEDAASFPGRSGGYHFERYVPGRLSVDGARLERSSRFTNTDPIKVWREWKKSAPDLIRLERPLP